MPLIGIIAVLFAVGAVAANAYPLSDKSQSVAISTIHLPHPMWIAVGLAHVADEWRSANWPSTSASLGSYVFLSEPDIRPALSHRLVTGVACT